MITQVSSHNVNGPQQLSIDTAYAVYVPVCGVHFLCLKRNVLLLIRQGIREIFIADWVTLIYGKKKGKETKTSRIERAKVVKKLNFIFFYAKIAKREEVLLERILLCEIFRLL